MRFIRKTELVAEDYVNKLSVREVSTIMKLKLNMIETKANFPTKYGEDRQCIMCGDNEETTEHLFKCDKYKELAHNNLEWKDNGDQWGDIEWLRQAARVVERIEEIREREINRHITEQ